MFNVTEKELARWGGVPLLKEAELVVRRGDVLNAAFEAPWASGTLRYSGRELRTRFRVLSGGMIDSHCPCVANQRDGRVCVHVVAVGLMLHRRATNPERQKLREAEARHAQAVATVEREGGFLRRAPAEAGGVPAEVRVRLPERWADQFWDGRIEVQCLAMMAGSPVPLDRIPRQTALALRREDEAILFVLEDICEGTPQGTVSLTRSDLMGLFEVHRVQRRRVFRAGGDPLVIQPESARVRVLLDLDRENGELLLFANAEIPGQAEPDPTAVIVAHANAGWVCAKGQLWPLDKTLPGPYQMVYRETVAIPRSDTVRFMRQELAKLSSGIPFNTEIDLGLFEIEQAIPQFSVRVKGTPASLSLTLYARYENGHDLPAGAAHALGDFAIPDPEDVLRYRVRDVEAEVAAVARLNRMGFKGPNGVALEPVVGERDVLNVLGSCVPALRRLGWQVSFEGRAAELAESLRMAVPVVRVVPGSSRAPGQGGDWFDVGLNVQAPDGATISAADVQRALMMGESFLRRGTETLLFDAESVKALRGVFRDCSSREGGEAGTFRLDAVYAPYVQASLDALDGVDVEQPPEWRSRAAAQNRQQEILPVDLGAPLDGILRPYQKEGVAWLRFLEANGVCGILADEMGLGKTLQTLSWLQLERLETTQRGKPSLIVCPTSLVDNWRHEARQFTPQLRVLTMSGAKRHERWEDLAEQDLVVTSYALLRRDIDRYRSQAFASIVLDEAQHIKNRSTQNAIAAKQLQARQRLVLTGTPMENSVADLWSILDFLMPGYLGDYDTFRAEYEIPLSMPGEPEADDAQRRLRRKLHPFLLRRKKADVAKDLPAKLIKVSYCALSPDQRVAYDALLNASRQKIGGLVAAQGFDRCRMEILAVLMKLRQVCCHLGLLKDEGLAAKASAPSAKVEQFLELLDEAMDGGHRMLVFSQFVGMLTLLRGELDARGIPYCYLDGATKERLEICQRFNRDAGIPLFLISLKAGGTGLNLTGADMVVHFDPWWNPAVEDQATDRAHRIGQKRTVYSIKLIAEGTVEEKVLDLQRRKQALIGAMVEGDEQTMAKLTWDDVRELLGMGA